MDQQINFGSFLSGTRRSSPVGNRPTFRIHNLINYDTVFTARATRGLSNTNKNQKKGQDVLAYNVCPVTC